MTPNLDRTRLEALTAKLATALKEHYLTAPAVDEANVFEALNAFALVVAMILAGTGNDRRAREFFDKAVKQQVKRALRDNAHMSGQCGQA